jgi:hypothetical protein
MGYVLGKPIGFTTTPLRPVSLNQQVNLLFQGSRQPWFRSQGVLADTPGLSRFASGDRYTLNESPRLAIDINGNEVTVGGSSVVGRAPMRMSASSGSSDWSTRLSRVNEVEEAISAIAEAGGKKDANAVNAIVAYAASENYPSADVEAVFRAADEAVVAMGGDALAPLISILQPDTQEPSFEQVIASRLISSLSEHGIDCDAAVDPLIGVLEATQDVQIIAGVAEALGSIGDPRGVDPLTAVDARYRELGDDDAVKNALKRLSRLSTQVLKKKLLHMIKINPRWKVYLGGKDIKYAKYVLRSGSGGRLISSPSEDRVAQIYNKVMDRQLDLFTRYAMAEKAKGKALQKVMSRVLTGRGNPFGSTTQKIVAGIVGVEMEVVPSDRGKGDFMSEYEQPSKERDQMVLRYIRDYYFNPVTGQLHDDTRKKILSTRSKDRHEILTALEELEYLLSKMD